VAVLATRKLVDRLWTRVTGDVPPTKKVTRDDD
jgi:hypothetical protein